MAAATTELRHELQRGLAAKEPTACTCKTDIEAKLLEQFKQQEPKAESHKVALQGYGFTLTGNRMRLVPFMNFKASADYPMKTGASRHRAKVGAMHFSFCPFCGQSLKEGR